MKEYNEQFPKMIEAVMNGGSLITYVNSRGLVYSEVVNWIYDKDGESSDRKGQYERALIARGEWVAQRILKELQRVGFSDVKKLYNDDGSIRSVTELDDDTAACIAGIDVEEGRTNADGEEVSPRVRKIKLVDKLKSLELLGKNLKMFTDRHEVTGTMSLEQLVTGSLPGACEGETVPPLPTEEAGKESVDDEI